MTKYTQLKLSNNVLVEVTDQNVYFEYDTEVCQPFLLYLSYTDFERVYKNLRVNTVVSVEDLTIEATSQFVHIMSDVLTVSFKYDDLETVYSFYQEIKGDLQESGRKAVVVYEGENRVKETRYASESVVDTVVEDVQSEYDETYEIDVVPVSEFQEK
jgi:hypothetical protein